MTASSVPAARRTRPAVTDRRAVQDILPVAAAVTPLGIAVGATVATIGVPLPIAAASSPLLYSGSAQLTYLSLAAAGAGLLSIIGSLVLANARMLIYSAGLAAHFRGQPTWFRWLAPTFIVDQTFAIVMARNDLGDPRSFQRYWLTAGTLLGVAWLSSNGVGALIGTWIADVLPLEVAAPALFIGLLVPRVTDRRSLVVTLAAAAVAAITYGPLGAAALPTAMTVGVAAAMLPRRANRSEQPS
jgi:predicted branched-subunit amino acid permease